MVKFKTVTYRRGMTLSVGSFESVRIDIEAQAEVEPHESFDEALVSVQDEVDEALRREAKDVRRRARGD